MKGFLISVLLLALGCESSRGGDAVRIKQYARELRNPLIVLAIALKPGDEDFRLLESLKFDRGALVTVAIVTNGQAGESDLGSAYPQDLAALRREEATRALESMGCSVRFLNLDSPGSVRDSAGMASIWNSDSVETRLMRAISSVRPHLVVLFPEKLGPSPSVAWQFLRTSLRNAVLRLRQPSNVRDLERLRNFPAWDVQRAVAGKSSGIESPASSNRVRRAETMYASLAVQREFWMTAEYNEILFPESSRKTAKVYDGLPSIPAALRSLHRKIGRFAGNILATRNLGPSQQSKFLRELVPLADSVDVLISAGYFTMRRPEQKLALVWKELLQGLKNEFLDVSVSYTLEDSALTVIQVTSLIVDSIAGISPEAKLWFHFPLAGRGWIVNESTEQRHPVVPGAEFRIVTPQTLRFNLPAQIEGLHQDEIVTPVDCFVINSTDDRMKNFAVRLRLPFRFAPKFTVEVLTPIVRAVDGEQVVVRLTNYSRDGVADRIGISDSLVSSPRKPFRLSVKEATVTDTLVLNRKEPAEAGSYLVPLDIDGIAVASVAARVFDAGIDQAASVGLISSAPFSAAAETIRRLGMTWARAHPSDVTPEWLSGRSVVLLDHRVSSLGGVAAGLNRLLLDFAATGNRVVVLSQDPETWNGLPLAKGLSLERDLTLAPEGDVLATIDHEILRTPNRLTEDDWDEWLYARAVNRLNVLPEAVVPLRDRDSGTPLIAIMPHGSGEVVYVNLNLPPQWLNIHAGSFRVLANLLSN